jgi:hypothetical protein
MLSQWLLRGPMLVLLRSYPRWTVPVEGLDNTWVRVQPIGIVDTPIVSRVQKSSLVGDSSRTRRRLFHDESSYSKLHRKHLPFQPYLPCRSQGLHAEWSPQARQLGSPTIEHNSIYLLSNAEEKTIIHAHIVETTLDHPDGQSLDYCLIYLYGDRNALMPVPEKK